MINAREASAASNRAGEKRGRIRYPDDWQPYWHTTLSSLPVLEGEKKACEEGCTDTSIDSGENNILPMDMHIFAQKR